MVLDGHVTMMNKMIIIASVRTDSMLATTTRLAEVYYIPFDVAARSGFEIGKTTDLGQVRLRASSTCSS